MSILKLVTSLLLIAFPIAVLIRDWKYHDKRTRLHHAITLTIIILWSFGSFIATYFVWSDSALIKELIDGKNTLIKQNIELSKKMDSYQEENNRLKREIDSLSKRTNNFDTLSDNKTKIGDLVLEKKDGVIAITPIENIINERLRYARSIARSGNINEALSIIEKVESSYPQNMPEEGKIMKADYLARKEDYRSSINILKGLEDATISSENQQVCYKLLGLCYYKISDYKESAKYLQLAIDKNTHAEITDESKKNLEVVKKKLE